MIKANKKPMLKVMYAALSTMLLCSVAQAGIVKVVTDADIDLVIEAGVGTVLPKKEDLNRSIKKGGTEVFTITKDTFGSDTFSITGKVTLPSMDNTCKLLSVEKDYKISFTSTKTGGVICKSESLPASENTK